MVSFLRILLASAALALPAAAAQAPVAPPAAPTALASPLEAALEHDLDVAAARRALGAAALMSLMEWPGR